MRVKVDFFEQIKKEENFLRGLIEIIFRITFISFTVFFILEYFLPGFVTNWFNPIWLLIIAIISGIIVITADY